MSIIEFREVSFAYGSSGAVTEQKAEEHGAPSALSAVSFAVQAGEFIAVLGANGSGKSTLARHINALLLPSSGHVLVAEVDTAQPETTFAVRSTAGLLFQNPDSQIIASIVADDVAFGPENLCVPQLEISSRVDQALEAVKMLGFANRDPHRLSGGQKQRVCIAGLLAMHPDVLVLDEPGAMLDARGRRGIRRVIAELNATGMTVVLITHFMEEAALADRLVVMESGHVALDGTPRQVFAQPDFLRSLGLELPFAIRLAEALREQGMELPELVSTPEFVAACRELTCGNNGYAAEGESEIDTLGRATLSGVEALQHTALSGESPAASAQLKLLAQPNQQTTNGAAALVVLREVCYSYPGDGGEKREQQALSKLNLEIAAGSLVGIIGHSGSGKSTLLQLISGLAQPDSGTVLVAGQNLSTKKARLTLPKNLGIAFQYPEYQLFGRTVAEEVGFAPHNAGLRAAEIEQRVYEALALVGLDYDRFANRSPFTLSGGEKRRVALAGIIAQNPQILLFDEPTNGLDPQTHQEILELIARLHCQGKTILLVAHDMDDIALLAQRVVVLNAGQIVMDDTPAEVFSHFEQLRAVNLDVPQATSIARGLGLHSLPLTLPQLAEDITSAFRGLRQ